MILQIIISNGILDLVTGILAKISLGTGILAKFRLGTGIWYPPSRPSLLNAAIFIYILPFTSRSGFIRFLFNYVPGRCRPVQHCKTTQFDCMTGSYSSPTPSPPPPPPLLSKIVKNDKPLRAGVHDCVVPLKKRPQCGTCLKPCIWTMMPLKSSLAWMNETANSFLPFHNSK